MIKYILPLLIIYFIYIHKKSIIINTNNLNNNNLINNSNNTYINFLIEKNILILLVSILSIIIITNTNKYELSNENMVYMIMLILINLVLWIRVIKFQNYNNIANELVDKEQFISSVAMERDYSYTTNDAKKQFEADFMDECYENKLLIPDFVPIVKPEDVEKEDAKIRETTIDLALNSDNMFSVQQKENKCIIANYIPNDLSLISNNLINNDENNNNLINNYENNIENEGLRDFYNCEYNTTNTKNTN